MVSYEIVFSKQAFKDRAKLKQNGLEAKAKHLLSLIKQDPYVTPPKYEKLMGNLKGLYSRRINIQHRLVYDVIEEEKTIHILRMWSHYGE